MTQIINNQLRIFEVIDTNGIVRALTDCFEAGYKPSFMPELVDQRINADADSPLWNNWFTTPSVRITGRTNQGTPVVVYAHIDNSSSNLANLKADRKRGGFQKFARPVSREEFQRFVDLEDNNTVFVVDYNALVKSYSATNFVKRALNHPQTIPFLGGRDRAERYLERHQQIYGNQIGIWHSDDFDIATEIPLGRLLFIGNDDIYSLNGGGYSYPSVINDDCFNYFHGRFLGVASEAHKEVCEAPRQAGAIASPTLEQALASLNPFFAPEHAERARAELAKLYQPNSQPK